MSFGYIVATKLPMSIYCSHKMGRKPLSDEPKTDRPLRIRLTEDERALLDSAAAKQDKGTSSWAREVLIEAAQYQQELKTNDHDL